MESLEKSLRKYSFNLKFLEVLKPSFVMLK